MKKFATVLLAVVLTFSALAFAACQPKGGNNDNNNVITELTDESIVGTWKFSSVTLDLRESDLTYPGNAELCQLYGFKWEEVRQLDDDDAIFVFTKSQLHNMLDEESSATLPSEGDDTHTRASLLARFCLMATSLKKDRIDMLISSSLEFNSDKTVTMIMPGWTAPEGATSDYYVDNSAVYIRKDNTPSPYINHEILLDFRGALEEITFVGYSKV